MKIPRPRGTRDFYPEEMEKRRALEQKMRRTAESWGYGEVATPTFEHLELFTLRSGEAIKNEIYAFSDKSERKLALRPELTAPAVRMYVDGMQRAPKPLRLYYFGNCFRYERPQKGRFREFWQFGVELIGGRRIYADAENMALAHAMLSASGLSTKLRVSHLEVVGKLLDELSEEHRGAVLRLIDKNALDELAVFLEQMGRGELLASLSALMESKGDPFTSLELASEISPCEGIGQLKSTLELLEAYDVPFEVDFRIVRGLDYYTGIVFEAYAKGLGAENQVCGGGSYALSELFGGEPVSSCGFGIGFDRVMEVCECPLSRADKVMVMNVGDTYPYAIRIANQLREGTQLEVQLDVMGRSIKEQLSRAASMKVRYAVIVGEREMREQALTLRDLHSGEQRVLGIGDAIEILREGTVFNE
ncbi:MAG: histidine--tRNA ligase [Methermicoccaceae archaeon]